MTSVPCFYCRSVILLDKRVVGCVFLFSVGQANPMLILLSSFVGTG